MARRAMSAFTGANERGNIMTIIAFIGLGNMGAGVAANQISAIAY